MRRAIALDPDLPDAQNSLGADLSATGDAFSAEAAFREAPRLDPYYATAHGNPAMLLAARGDLEQAAYHFGKAVRLQAAYAPDRYEYALTLVRMNRYDQSEEESRAAVLADPNLAEAPELPWDCWLARGTSTKRSRTMKPPCG